jgi:glycerol kinase
VLVPAFSGLFAPYWRPDARGLVAGLTRHTSRAHLARAAFDACAWQVAELAEALALETGEELTELRVDGGVAESELLLGLQADALGIPVAVPAVRELTAAGAAFAAGLAVGFWSGLDEVRAAAHVARRVEPSASPATRRRELARWRAGVRRSLDWTVDVE